MSACLRPVASGDLLRDSEAAPVVGARFRMGDGGGRSAAFDGRRSRLDAPLLPSILGVGGRDRYDVEPRRMGGCGSAGFFEDGLGSLTSREE